MSPVTPRKGLIENLGSQFLRKRGDNHGIQGGLYPDQTDVRDLGSTTRRWGTIYADAVVADTLTGGGAVSAYTDLTDTPAAFSGDANQFVAVNAAENALEHINLAGGDGIAKAIGSGVQTLSVDLASPSGLAFNTGKLYISSSVIAGNGLTGGGVLSSNATLDVGQETEFP